MMPWWPWDDTPWPPRTPARPTPPPDPGPVPDPFGIFCTCCPARLGRWRFPHSDVLVCAVCDNPPSEAST